eukprot:TRINITY_DN611_c0_g1_i1.p2 TRINITY_DN611_c0_g1~~TRINITY_DN611_c0_g1_i1.p2  ORF type:complete len:269 (-),score=79.06 TRINITY_DN611_c0_g1_i1:111-917(-)
MCIRDRRRVHGERPVKQSRNNLALIKMNPIQKAWLKVLSPLAYVINEKLAKRSGFFGRIGKFFIIGPREYGVHPLNKLFQFFNRRYMFAQAYMANRYGVLKFNSQNGYYTLRPFRHLAWVPPFFAIVAYLKFFYFTDTNRGYEPDKLTYLSRRIGGKMGLPLNSLNQRTSAHYIEINYIYGAEMLKRYHRVHQKIIEERNKASDQVRKTLYADPSYKYTPMKPVNINESAVPLQTKHCSLIGFAALGAKYFDCMIQFAHTQWHARTRF